MNEPFMPTFLTNDVRRGVAVGKDIARYLDAQIEGLQDPPNLDIATAYFNPGGFAMLREPLKRLGRVRLLLGAEPDDAPTPAPLTPRRRGRRGIDPQVAKAADEHEQALRMDRDMLGFSIDADRDARDLVEWLEGGDGGTPVEVRRLTRGFLHGKAYVMHGSTHVAAFSGSSNFTRAGLGFNRELNLGSFDAYTVAEVSDWFEEMWRAAEPYDLAALYAARWQPHSPQLIFLRMLWERYHLEVEEEKADTSAGELRLTNFQRDGVWRARRILNRLRGVIIADEVGLGKTYLAGELIADALIKRRQRVLIICPATLRDSTWRPFLREKNLQTDVLSFEELVREVEDPGTTGSKLGNLDDYAMVVVDEAHALRNAGSRRAAAMRELATGKSPKDLVLLTATPVNNSLKDVQNLLSYFITNDAQFTDVGVPSLAAYFKRAMDLHPDELSPEHLFDVLDQVAVRRTRQFVRNHYASDTVWVNGAMRRISFPEATVRRVDYSLDEVAPDVFDDVAVALGARVDEDGDDGVAGVVAANPGEVLTMARYVPSKFLLDAGDPDRHQFECQNAGLLRSALLKRFESSAFAYANTLDKLILSHEDFISALDEGYVLSGAALRDWGGSSSDDLVDFLESRDDADTSVSAAADYDVESLRWYCAQDLVLLRRLRDRARELVSLPDPKIDRLVGELADIAAEAEEEGRTDEERRNKRKVLIFTYFADTAQHIQRQLAARIMADERLAAYRDRMVTVTGADSDQKAALIARFAPNTAGTKDDPDEYDVVIATDVLAEGVNLQQARHIINYDLPWNPMRLVQRHGRIDRIGSPHNVIYLRCFFPDEHLEEMLGLEERLQNKLKAAAAAFGVGSGVLPGVKGRDTSYTETRETIMSLREGDSALFDSGGGAALSGEDYRRTLEQKLDDPELRRRIEQLPWGSGSGFETDGGDAGVVFCLRIGDHDKPWYRFVPLHPVTLTPREAVDEHGITRPVVVDDSLASLSPADPGAEPRVLDEEMRLAVFRAWEVARDHVVDTWNFQADPANLRPTIPRVLREAGDFLARHGGILGEQQGSYRERLQAPHDTRIQREVRAALKSAEDGDPADAVQRIREIVDRHNLSGTPAIAAKPEISAEHVNLICWQAFRPRHAPVR